MIVHLHICFFRVEKTDRVLKQSANTNEANTTTKYKRIKLCNNKVQKDSYIHTLVATLYIPNPDNKPFILHKNFNSDDNSVDNLCWLTLKEIMEYYSINNKKITNEELASPM